MFIHVCISLYFKGIGCERNDKLCMHYYKQAADLEYPEGLFMLGMMSITLLLISELSPSSLSSLAIWLATSYKLQSS